jgi:hypothetical protein
MPKSTFIRALTLALPFSAALIFPGISHSQEDVATVMSDMRLQMAKVGGQAQAAAKACGDYSDAELAKLKQQQRNALTAEGSGFSAEAFDKAFAEGERETTKNLNTMSKSEQAEMCKKLQQQSGMGGL